MFKQRSSSPGPDAQSGNGIPQPQLRRAAQERQIANNITLTIQINA